MPNPHLASLEDAMAHPMWETQVELERGMLRAGADRFRDRVVEAKSRGQMTRLDPVRGLLNDWLPTVAEGLHEWVKTMSRIKRGPVPLALPLLRDLDPYVATMIGLRTILDGITLERNSVTALSVTIGRIVEHEQQVRLWEKANPEVFHAVQNRLERSAATSHHRSVVNIFEFNRLLAEGKLPGAGWTPWTEEQMFRVGVEIINAIVRTTRWFELREDPSFVPRKGVKKGPKLVLVPKGDLVSWLAGQLEHAEIMSPVYKPTVIPPKRWEGSRGGGYWTGQVRAPRLVRFRSNQVEQRDRAADEYDALDMPEMYDAIHFLQEVPWRVNQRVFAVMEQVAARNLELGGVPDLSQDGKPLPERLPGMPEAGDREGTRLWAEMEENKEAFKQWKRRANAVYRANLKLFSRQRSFTATLGVAKQYGEYDRFYFPHMLDFRGRMYAIPVGLNPQGDDVARGLPAFADGRTITEDNGGGAWLAIHLASTWGNDKISFDERVDWVEANREMWLDIAEDPLGNDMWARADKPWQALAAVFDWVEFITTGYGYLSHTPVAVDGTCNGIQHLSAMTRDEEAGAYVNLTPGEKPRDIYKFVARHLQDKVVRIAAAGGYQAELADYWLAITGGDFPRSLTKRQVMVLPYGGSKDSFFEYTRAWLDEHDPMPEGSDWELRSKRLAFLVGHMWDTVKEHVKGAMEIMEWLQKCAKVAAIGNQPVFWQVVTGFVVRHFYGQQLEKIVTVKLDGQRSTLLLKTTSKDLDVKSQLRGIPPNFVHSQDAAALVLSVNKAAAAGLVGFTSVHDAYGTHAADMEQLSVFLREAFVEVHNANPLGMFRAACQSVIVAVLMTGRPDLDPLEAAEIADEKLPPMPPLGTLDLDLVLSSPYFFA